MVPYQRDFWCNICFDHTVLALNESGDELINLFLRETLNVNQACTCRESRCGIIIVHDFWHILVFESVLSLQSFVSLLMVNPSSPLAVMIRTERPVSVPFHPNSLSSH